jgi:ketosteroid isomerase-like protein
MSQENVEITQRMYAALADGDIEGFLAFVDPDVEFHSLILEIEGVFHGHEGVREWWTGIRTTFPDWDPSIVSLRSVGDQVVVRARQSGSGAASGVGLEEDFWQVAELREGLMTRYRALRTEQEALEAAGLSE